MADNYYALGRDNKYYQVDGVPVTIKGFEELDLFAHPALHDGHKITISEGLSGCRIASGKDVEEASVTALEELIFKGPDEIIKRRAALVKEYGPSPRYATGVAPAVAAAPAPPPETSQAENHGVAGADSQTKNAKGFTGPSRDPQPCG